MSANHLLTTAPIMTASPVETDLTSFEAFFRQSYPAIVATAVRITGNVPEAEEIASEAFVRLCRETVVIQNRAGWLKRCAIRLSLDYLRASHRRKRREEASIPAADIPSPETTLWRNQQKSQVRQILAELPKRDAEVLLARAEGLSYAEIAGSFGLNPASVGKLLTRAEANFKRRYESHYGTY